MIYVRNPMSLVWEIGTMMCCSANRTRLVAVSYVNCQGSVCLAVNARSVNGKPFSIISTLSYLLEAEWNEAHLIRLDKRLRYHEASVREWTNERGIALEIFKPSKRERGVGRFNRILKQEHLTKIEYRGSLALMMETDYWIDKYNERYKGRR